MRVHLIFTLYRFSSDKAALDAALSAVDLPLDSVSASSSSGRGGSVSAGYAAGDKERALYRCVWAAVPRKGAHSLSKQALMCASGTEGSPLKASADGEMYLTLTGSPGTLDLDGNTEVITFFLLPCQGSSTVPTVVAKGTLDPLPYIGKPAKNYAIKLREPSSGSVVGKLLFHLRALDEADKDNDAGTFDYVDGIRSMSSGVDRGRAGSRSNSVGSNGATEEQYRSSARYTDPSATRSAATTTTQSSSRIGALHPDTYTQRTESSRLQEGQYYRRPRAPSAVSLHDEEPASESGPPPTRGLAASRQAKPPSRPPSPTVSFLEPNASSSEEVLKISIERAVVKDESVSESNPAPFLVGGQYCMKVRYGDEVAYTTTMVCRSSRTIEYFEEVSFQLLPNNTGGGGSGGGSPEKLRFSLWENGKQVAGFSLDPHKFTSPQAAWKEYAIPFRYHPTQQSSSLEVAVKRIAGSSGSVGSGAAQRGGTTATLNSSASQKAPAPQIPIVKNRHQTSDDTTGASAVAASLPSTIQKQPQSQPQGNSSSTPLRRRDASVDGVAADSTEERRAWRSVDRRAGAVAASQATSEQERKDTSTPLRFRNNTASERSHAEQHSTSEVVRESSSSRVTASEQTRFAGGMSQQNAMLSNPVRSSTPDNIRRGGRAESPVGSVDSLNYSNRMQRFSSAPRGVDFVDSRNATPLRYRSGIVDDTPGGPADSSRFSRSNPSPALPDLRNSGRDSHSEQRAVPDSGSSMEIFLSRLERTRGAAYNSVVEEWLGWQESRTQSHSHAHAAPIRNMRSSSAHSAFSRDESVNSISSLSRATTPLPTKSIADTCTKVPYDARVTPRRRENSSGPGLRPPVSSVRF